MSHSGHSKISINVPVQNSHHNFCGNCNEKYKNYLEHIQSYDHKSIINSHRGKILYEIDEINKSLEETKEKRLDEIDRECEVEYEIR